ncbi:MAG: glutamate racemase [Elusimicrobiota bacterium]|nr:glutamate racemase [Elusimicrobiota bacterium]
MQKQGNAIGIFDSGLGGLTILRSVRSLLPKENIIYFGDTARVPYGSKSKETVTSYSLQIAEFLQSRKVKLILIACNTASALALEAVRAASSAPVLGVIAPGAKCAAAASKNKKVAVLATEATVKSKAYPKHLARADKKIKTAQYACPLFVPIIEEGLLDDKLTALVIERYLKPVKKLKADTIILGCTHYPVIKDAIAKTLGGKVQLVDSAEEIAKEAKELLAKNNLLKKTGPGKTQMFVSDDPKRFAAMAVNIIGGKKPKVKQVRL